MTVKSYFEDIRRYPLLTPSGEFRVATASRDGGQAARQQLIESNLRLVVKLAMDYRHTRIGLDDLIAEGNLGLMEAAKRFDPSRGVRFASYATWWIKKYLIQAIHRQAHQTTAPVDRGPGETPSDAGRAPHPLRDRQTILSIDGCLQTSSDRHVLETIAADSQVGPEEVALERQLSAALISILPKLPEQERTILAAHYGLDGDSARTLQQIGAELGMTRERVRQIEQRAVDRARRLLEHRKRR